MPKGKPEDSSILEYALRALEQERDSIQEKIDQIRRQLGVRRPGRPPASASKKASVTAAPAPAATKGTARKKRVLSEAARKRIAAAQKRRWAEHRKGQKAAE